MRRRCCDRFARADLEAEVTSLRERTADLEMNVGAQALELAKLRSALHDLETSDLTVAVQERAAAQDQRDALVLRLQAVQGQLHAARAHLAAYGKALAELDGGHVQAAYNRAAAEAPITDRRGAIASMMACLLRESICERAEAITNGGDASDAA